MFDLFFLAPDEVCKMTLFLIAIHTVLILPFLISRSSYGWKKFFHLLLCSDDYLAYFGPETEAATFLH